MGKGVKNAYSTQQAPFSPGPCFLINFMGNGLCAHQIGICQLDLLPQTESLGKNLKCSQIKVVNLNTIIPTVRANSQFCP